MTAAVEIRAARVRDALAAAPWSVEELGRARWLLAHEAGVSVSAQARVTGDWLQLEAAPVPGAPEVAALERNLALAGLAKLACAPGVRALQARAELPLDVDGDLAVRVRDTLAGIAAAAGVAFLAARDVRPIGDPAADAHGSVAALCRDAGWPFVECGPLKLAVDLGLRGVFARARVEESSETGAVRVSAEVEVLPALLPDACRRALATFLLRMAAVVRLVRPVVERRQDSLGIGFEASYASPPSPGELARALAALSVACQLSGREVGVLARDKTVARAYLAADGMSNGAGPAAPAATGSVTLAATASATLPATGSATLAANRQHDAGRNRQRDAR